jgi:hypothetical protein
MADLIPNPITPAPPQTNTDYSRRPGDAIPQSPDGKIANLSDLTQVVRNHNMSEEMGEQNLADQTVLIPRNDAFVPRDPAIAAKLLRALLGADMFSSLRANGSEELINKLAEFADEVMRTPETLADDLVMEQSKTTMFSGDLWKILSGILADKINPDAEGVNLAKLLGQSSTIITTTEESMTADDGQPGSQTADTGIYTNPLKPSERNALYENKMNTLQADAAKPHTMTTEQMKNLVQNRDALAEFPKNEIYKNAAVDFLKAAVTTASKEDIINSVAANLKFLAHEAAPSMAVRNELNKTADSLNPATYPALKEKILSLLNTTSSSLLLSDKTKALIPLAVYNMSRLSYGTKDLTQSFSELIKLSDPKTAEAMRTAFIKYIEQSELSSEDKVQILEGSEIASAKHSMTLIAERLADSAAGTIGVTPVEDLADTLERILDLFRRDTRVFDDEEYNYSDEQISVNANNNTAKLHPDLIPKATQTIREMVSEFTPDKMKGALNTVIRDFERTKNLNEFAGRLSMIVNKIPEPDKKMVLAQALNDILGPMAADKSVNYTPPTATETLSDFLAKNINDPALKTLSELNPGEMVRSLLAAPGSNTPLMHMMAPLELGGLRAFGEIWADPNAEWIDPNDKQKKNGGNGANERVSHVFLAFDVEDTGYFEMEVYARDKELNIAVMCPSGMEERFAALEQIIPELCKTQGFFTSGMNLSSIVKPRELREVFPKLTREITTLNVRC